MLPAQPRAGRVQPSQCQTAFENRAPAPGGTQLTAGPYSPTAPTSHLFLPRGQRAHAEETPWMPHSSLPLCANAVQVLKWRMPMDAEQHEVYAYALFGAAADALLASPMQDES